MINPHVSTVGVIGFDRTVHAARLVELVRSSGRHLGAMSDPDGEQLTLVDDTGHVLDDDEALLALTLLVSRAEPEGVIAVPVDASVQVEALCAATGAEVLRTKLSGTQLLEGSRSSRVVLAANTSGGFVYPHFVPAFDAVATLVRLLSLLALSKETALERSRRASEDIHCPTRRRRPVPTKGPRDADACRAGRSGRARAARRPEDYGAGRLDPRGP